MGSKLLMLRGELGHRLMAEAANANRVIDLFTGSGAVSHYIAERVAVPTVSVDSMALGGIFAGSITTRTAVVDANQVWREWRKRADALLASDWQVDLVRFGQLGADSRDAVFQARTYCTAVRSEAMWLVRHYGGYYFSPLQAVQLAAFRATLPRGKRSRMLCLAALLRTASRTAASPGHTAQPFQPTPNLLAHLQSCWNVSIERTLVSELVNLSKRYALRAGSVFQGDGEEYVRRYVERGDLVFCDPPYSAAQYSRFYHVLEGIARGGWSEVSGAGRAPIRSDRTTSDFSLKSAARGAAESLLSSLAERSSTVMWTYPEGERSNGLSCDDIRSIAAPLFAIEETVVDSVHSTLGGGRPGESGRNSRVGVQEVLFKFKPRDSRKV